eukprot:scaffold67004_cov51-Phaeocystis_antarctica.AAC.2
MCSTATSNPHPNPNPHPHPPPSLSLSPLTAHHSPFTLTQVLGLREARLQGGLRLAEPAHQGGGEAPPLVRAGNACRCARETHAAHMPHARPPRKWRQVAALEAEGGVRSRVSDRT